MFLVNVSIKPLEYNYIIGQFNLNFMALNDPKSFKLKENPVFIIPTTIGPILNSQFYVVAITLGALVGLLIVGALLI
jgi:hypothetical protein